MILKLFRWFLGYVVFSFEKGFAEGFLNDCFEEKINIHCVQKKQNGFNAMIISREYKKLHKLARKNGGKVKILKKGGLPFILLPLRNRFGLLIGAVLLILINSYLGGCIWNIEITGQERISEEAIVYFLDQNSVTIGQSWSKIEKNKLECLLMKEFSDIAWVKINQIGTTARVEIGEATIATPIIDKNIVTNVVAKKDGVILNLKSNQGWDAVKKGDAVTKGDLLISGIKESEVDKKNYYTHAYGEVLATVDETIKVNVRREQLSKVSVSTKSKKSLLFLGKDLSISKFFLKSKTNREIERNKKFIKINGKELPFGIVTTVIEEFDNQSYTLADEELKLIAKEELEKKVENELLDAQIISCKEHFEFSTDYCTGSAKIVSIQDIAKVQEVKIEEIKME